MVYSLFSPWNYRLPGPHKMPQTILLSRQSDKNQHYDIHYLDT
nr:MAG TPA: hypothetical protein [Caudoviricetes sp.]DAT11951.1 MAG TPA: hypothetical protein [Bacteriophage sp.]